MTPGIVSTSIRTLRLTYRAGRRDGHGRIFSAATAVGGVVRFWLTWVTWRVWT